MAHPGYSDPINHAFAFAAKYARRPASADVPWSHVTHPYNVAVILASYDCDEATIVAGILHHVLEESLADERRGLEEKIGQKFGPTVLLNAQDATEPRFDHRGRERPWRACKAEYLNRLSRADRPALEIAAADHILQFGVSLTVMRRLGPEYFRRIYGSGPEETLWWCRSLFDLIGERADWRLPAMLSELRHLGVQVVGAVARDR